MPRLPSLYTQRLSVALNGGLVEQIDEVAREHHVQRSIVMRYALEAGLKAARARIRREAGSRSAS